MVYTNKEISDALNIINSSLESCIKVQPKLKEGSPSLSLSKNRIKALEISKCLLMNRSQIFTLSELEEAKKQITSILNKSNTGLNNAKPRSATHTRFSKIIHAMKIILTYLDTAIEVQDK